MLTFANAHEPRLTLSHRHLDRAAQVLGVGVRVRAVNFAPEYRRILDTWRSAMCRRENSFAVTCRDAWLDLAKSIFIRDYELA